MQRCWPENGIFNAAFSEFFVVVITVEILSFSCTPKEYYYCPDAKQNSCYWPPYHEKNQRNNFRSGRYCMFVRASNQLGYLDSRIYTVADTSDIGMARVVHRVDDKRHALCMTIRERHFLP